MTKEVIESVKILTKAIKDDPELYYAYQANIAMAFKDEFDKIKPMGGVKGNSDLIHDVANNAAKNFLNMWIR